MWTQKEKRSQNIGYGFLFTVVLRTATVSLDGFLSSVLKGMFSCRFIHCLVCMGSILNQNGHLLIVL